MTLEDKKYLNSKNRNYITTQEINSNRADIHYYDDYKIEDGMLYINIGEDTAIYNLSCLDSVYIHEIKNNSKGAEVEGKRDIQIVILSDTKENADKLQWIVRDNRLYRALFSCTYHICSAEDYDGMQADVVITDKEELIPTGRDMLTLSTMPKGDRLFVAGEHKFGYFIRNVEQHY